MALKNSSSGNGYFIGFILVLAAIGGALKLFQENWPIIAVIGGAILLILIVRSVKQAKARKEYLLQPVVYIGNASTKTFHIIPCRLITDIHQKNRVPFRSYEEAVRKGYSPCGVCKPRAVRK